MLSTKLALGTWYGYHGAHSSVSVDKPNANLSVMLPKESHDFDFDLMAVTEDVTAHAYSVSEDKSNADLSVMLPKEYLYLVLSLNGK